MAGQGEGTTGRANVQIRHVATPEDLEQVKSLLGEYMRWITVDLGVDLTFQSAEAELASLPGAYSPPAGCLLLAEVDGELAGCAALRPLGEGICEMKRMYVRPTYRGRGIGRELAGRVIHEARARGYRLMRLDTIAAMKAAQHLYASLGFRPTRPYYSVPAQVRDAILFMELPLGGAGTLPPAGGSRRRTRAPGHPESARG